MVIGREKRVKGGGEGQLVGRMGLVPRPSGPKNTTDI